MNESGWSAAGVDMKMVCINVIYRKALVCGQVSSIRD
jgi:hypothetical protein